MTKERITKKSQPTQTEDTGVEERIIPEAEIDITPTVRFLEAELEKLNNKVDEIAFIVNMHNKHPQPDQPTDTSPRRHNTYVVQDGETSVPVLAKKLFGVSGRYVEIMSLNPQIEHATGLKEGMVLDLPKS